MFCGKHIPCVGVSIGVERIFAILHARAKAAKEDKKVRTTATEVYIIGLGSGHLQERMRIARELWDAGLSAEYTFKTKPRREKEFGVARDEQIPVTVIVDDAKVAAGEVQVENTATKEKVVVKKAE
ncbi:hypothetical protein HK405_010700, partial [Cladochytrium tenue]